MYCPMCSQQQVSDEMRFCSRCGFPLSAVRELVASGGVLMEHEVEAQGGQLSPSLRGMRKGVWMMLASLPLALVAGVLAAIEDVFAVFVLLPALCLIAGFVRLLYGTFLEKSAPPTKNDALQPQVVSGMPAQIDTAGRRTELPPPAGLPEGFTAPGIKTAEMVEPPSVTENTTRMLDKKVGSRRE